MADDPLEFWNIVGKPGTIDDVSIGVEMLIDEHRDGKPWRQRRVVVTGIVTDPDGARHVQFQDAPEDPNAKDPNIVCVVPG